MDHERITIAAIVHRRKQWMRLRFARVRVLAITADLKAINRTIRRAHRNVWMNLEFRLATEVNERSCNLHKWYIKNYQIFYCSTTVRFDSIGAEFSHRSSVFFWWFHIRYHSLCTRISVLCVFFFSESVGRKQNKLSITDKMFSEKLNTRLKSHFVFFYFVIAVFVSVAVDRNANW